MLGPAPTKPCSRCGKVFPSASLVREHVRPRFLDPSDRHAGVVRVCRECSVEAAEEQYSDYLFLVASHNHDTYKAFLASLYEIEGLSKLRMPDKKLSESMAGLLYAAVVTAMETYLADTLINRTMGNPKLLRRCLESAPEFATRAVPLTQLFVEHEKVETTVRQYLVEVIYHNLAKVNRMYRDILGVEFPPKMGDLYKAIERRHDLVHRGGKSKSGERAVVAHEAVRALIADIKHFVSVIEEQLPPEGTS